MSANLATDRNLKGQIRRKPVRDALDAILSRPADDPLNDQPKTVAQKLAMMLVREALAGDADARSEVIDRTDGKAAQSIEHSGHIARSHEEELEHLDQLTPDDTTRDGASPPPKE